MKVGKQVEANKKDIQYKAEEMCQIFEPSCCENCGCSKNNYKNLNRCSNEVIQKLVLENELQNIENENIRHTPSYSRYDTDHCKLLLPSIDKKMVNFLPNGPFDDRTIYRIEYLPKNPCTVPEEGIFPSRERDCMTQCKTQAVSNGLLPGPPLQEPIGSKYSKEYVLKPSKSYPAFNCRNNEEKLTDTEIKLLHDRHAAECNPAKGNLCQKYKICCDQTTGSECKKVKKVVAKARINTHINCKNGNNNMSSKPVCVLCEYELKELNNYKQALCQDHKLIEGTNQCKTKLKELANFHKQAFATNCDQNSKDKTKISGEISCICQHKFKEMAKETNLMINDKKATKSKEKCNYIFSPETPLTRCPTSHEVQLMTNCRKASRKNDCGCPKTKSNNNCTSHENPNENIKKLEKHSVLKNENPFRDDKICRVDDRWKNNIISDKTVLSCKKRYF